MSLTKYPKIIGITGRKGNGKDTLGDHLVTQHGYKRIAFADALKDACKCVFGFNDDQLYGNSKETIDDFWQTSPRTVLQFVGTELFREQLFKIMPWINQDIWVNVVKKKILDELKVNPDLRFVITDVRFSNELELIKYFDGVTIRVTRPCANNVTDIHPSEIEIELLPVNYDILNNTTKENLYQQSTNVLFAN